MNLIRPTRSVDDKSLIPTRASLIQRLKDAHDDESWRDFFDTYWKLIYNSAIHAGLNDAEGQDVVQETVLAAWKSLPTFQYDREGSFKGWLLQLTRWRISDCLRRRQGEIQPLQLEAGTEIGTRVVDRVADPGADLEAIWDAEFESNLVDVAIERVKGEVDPRDYQIFDLYGLKDWPALKVAQTLGVSRARVYLVKHRVGGRINRALRELRQSPANGKLASKK